MKRLLLLTAALATCFPVFAPVAVQADTVGAVTVSACGTPPNTPVVGGSYPLTMNLIGQLCDAPTGTSASGATDDGSNPLKVGGVYNSTAPILTTGQRGTLSLSSHSTLLVSMADPSSGNTFSVLQGNNDAIAASSIGSASLAFGMLYNGTTWNRAYSAPGAAGQGNTGLGALAVEESGRTYANITTATSTQVKATKGFLHKIIVNTAVAAATITIYDNTSCATTKIGTITLPATATPMVLEYNVAFATGLCITTSGATDLTIAYR